MASTTALPLSQQVLPWVLQALGLFDPDHLPATVNPLVSRSTLRSAYRGDPIRSWDKLVEHFFVVLGVHLYSKQRHDIAVALHDMDAKVSALDPLGLPLEDRLPPALRLLLPHLGVRLGALAALADLHLAPDPRTGRKPPPIGDALSEPLNPRFFGTLVEFMLWRHQPDWRTLEEQTYQLENRRIASRKTIERWRSPQIEVPNVVNLVALAGILGDDSEQQRALAVLRLGRLLVQLRQDLAEWTDEALAQDSERCVASWARTTRAALVRPDAPAELAELVVEILETPSGDAYLDALRSRWPNLGFDAVSTKEVAARLHDAACRSRAGEDPSALRCLILDQIIAPVPLVLPFVGERLTRGGYLLTMAADPFAILQGAWSLAAMLRRILVDEIVEVQPPGAANALPVRPDDVLRALVTDLLSRLRRLGHEHGEQPPTEVVFLRLLTALFNAADVPWEPESLAGAWNDAMHLLVAPVGIEPFASEEDVRAAPHLAPTRARRLAAEGEDKDALAWLAWWRNQPGPKSWEERMSAAGTMVTLAHGALDRVASARTAVRTVPLADLSVFSPASPEQLQQLGRNLTTLLRQAQEIGEHLLVQAASLTDDPPDPRGAMFRVTLLLPLVVRLDHLAVDLPDDTKDRQRRSDGLARELEQWLEVLPSHGDAWATLAAWQELKGLQPLAAKQARHFGAGHTHDALRKMFERDGLLVQK